MDRSERLHSGDGFLEKNFTFPATFGVEGKWALVAAFGVQVGVEHSELHGHSDNICCHLHPHVLQMTSCVNLLLVWYNERLLFIISSWLLGAIGAIQVLRNADGGGGVSDFLKKSVTKV